MYKIKEIAEILNVSDKSVRRYLNSYFSINNGAYEVSEKMLNILKMIISDNLRTTCGQAWTQKMNFQL